ncbi:hypothetical protein [Sphingomonas sp. Leaf226]|uniref:hypothetical protein n=1 Tax=Sphingomonas sp. Leaf226 TaxID=1735691 RepID=UPI0006F651B5|nr:hypothetical protein [Sphingomonas sp. Leaf226]KQM99461.1 hypothetical protein ASE77_00225 [Sphingomonas sp. Leaf226]
MSGAVEGVALLPCPFCGNDDPLCYPVEEGSPIHRGGCGNADCILFDDLPGNFTSREHFAEWWNTRTTPPARSYADGLAVAAKHLDERAERARVAAIGGGMDPLDAELLDYEYSNAAAAIRLLSQGEKA